MIQPLLVTSDQKPAKMLPQLGCSTTAFGLKEESAELAVRVREVIEHTWRSKGTV